LKIGQAALSDTAWADQTRARLSADAERLDWLMRRLGARPMGACPLFRTYEVADAGQLHHHLAQRKIWTRVFPYSQTWIRLGLPAQGQWERLEAAL